MKILHTADIHLTDYGNERWKTLQKLIEIGKKERIDIFVVCGDLFDREFNAEMLRPKIREIFSNNGFKIILLPGNHDSESYKSGMYFGDDVTILNNLNEPFEHKNLNIWGLPFEHIEGEEILYKLYSLESALNKEKRNILLYHGELLDAFFLRKDFGDEGERRYMPVKLSYFKDFAIDYVLAGHFHSKFDMWEFESGKYFVYSGSPISITKAEVGQRKANLFEVGKPPKEHPLDTPHFEEVVIKFDPFVEKNPLEMVKDQVQMIHPKARIILRIKGYVNCQNIKMDEPELVRQIRDICKGKPVEEYFEFSDIHIMLEDDLFRGFMKKLEQSDYDEEKKKHLCDIAIKAMMEVKL